MDLLGEEDEKVFKQAAEKRHFQGDRSDFAPLEYQDGYVLQ